MWREMRFYFRHVEYGRPLIEVVQRQQKMPTEMYGSGVDLSRRPVGVMVEARLYGCLLADWRSGKKKKKEQSEG